MKTYLITTIIAVFFFIFGLAVSSAFTYKQVGEPTGYLLEHEDSIGKEEQGPHRGGGMSTAYSFFSKAVNSKLVFRKRVLHSGAAIGYHLQKEEEIYYIESGTGEMMMNGKSFTYLSGQFARTKADRGKRPGSHD